MKFKKVIFSLILLGNIGVMLPSGGINNFLKGAAAVGIGIGLYQTSIFIHELGHAGMAKMMNDSPIKITLGKNTDKPLYKNKWLTVEKLLFIGGSGESKKSNSKFKNVMIAVAGPISGATFGLLALKYLSSNNMFPSIYYILSASIIGNLMSLMPNNDDGVILFSELFNKSITLNQTQSNIASIAIGFPILFVLSKWCKF